MNKIRPLTWAIRLGCVAEAEVENPSLYRISWSNWDSPGIIRGTLETAWVEEKEGKKLILHERGEWNWGGSQRKVQRWERIVFLSGAVVLGSDIPKLDWRLYFDSSHNRYELLNATQVSHTHTHTQIYIYMHTHQLHQLCHLLVSMTLDIQLLVHLMTG